MILKKKFENVLIFDFDFWFFPQFLKELKVRRPGRKTSGFRAVRILKICRTSGPDVMFGRALVEEFKLVQIFEPTFSQNKKIQKTYLRP